MTTSLEDRLDRDSESWRPEPGDKLVGTVVEVSTFQGDYQPYPVIEVEKDDGTVWAFHAYHTVAKNEIARLEPAEGDKIGIKYFGKVKTKPGSKYDSYEKYAIKVQKASGEVPDAPDWKAMKAETDAELDEAEKLRQSFPGATDEEPF